MHILISGSTGLIGGRLKRAFRDAGFEVSAVGRSDFLSEAEALAEKVSGADVVIHLAGAPIIGRWTKKYKNEILSSRVETTRKLVHAVNGAAVKPRLFISASAVGIYPGDGVYDETATVSGDDFLAEVCRRWEAEASALTPETGLAIFRFGAVLSKEGGALKKMLLPFRLGLGGPVAGGKQGFSWIHTDDLAEAFLFVIKHKLTGIFNLTAPQITDNATFTKALGKALHRPAFFPIPAFGLKMVYGEGASVLTSGQKVLPARLQKEGFVFRYPNLELALGDLLK